MLQSQTRPISTTDLPQVTSVGMTPIKIIEILRLKGVGGTDSILKMIKREIGDHQLLNLSNNNFKLVTVAEAGSRHWSCKKLQDSMGKHRLQQLSTEDLLDAAHRLVIQELIEPGSTREYHLNCCFGIGFVGDVIRFSVKNPKQTFQNKDVLVLKSVSATPT